MTIDVIWFQVAGKPQPQGSSRIVHAGGRPTITSDNPNLHEWRSVVGWHAVEAMQGHRLIERPGAVALQASFTRPRPKSAAKRVTRPTTKPDVDKLLRALLDALSGICYRDDAQVVDVHVQEYFAIPGCAAGVTVKLWEIEAANGD